LAGQSLKNAASRSERRSW